MNIAGLSAAEVAAQLVPHVPTGAGRQLVALAGAPASGKSTLAKALVSALDQSGRPAGLLAMDGFHLDNVILDARDLRARKGAPETFDLDGFIAMVQRVKTGANVFVPTFDRARDAAIAASAQVTEAQDVVVVEGNYLLLDAPGWRELTSFWDVSVFLDVPERVLAERLVMRWRDHGFDADTARAKAEDNDLPNARLVLDQRVTDIDLTLRA